jgi:uncharacterized membrane-anchored protein YitT (DUF2179 family)
MENRVKDIAVDFVMFFIGACIYAISVDAFTAPNNIAPGGITGIATLLNYSFGTPIGVMELILNIPIIIWAIIQIGYKLVVKTIISVIFLSVSIDLLAPVIPVYHGDPVINALFAGVFAGIGLALFFIRGSTTGGTDLIAKLLNNKIRFISMGKLMFTVDCSVIIVSAVVYKSVESAMYAFVVVFVTSLIVDKVLYGTDIGNGKMFFVVSNKTKEIADSIMNDMGRGVTFIKSRGGYSNKDGELILCAVRRYEVYQIHDIIRKIDKDAFVIVGDAGEITGEGFKSTGSNDKTIKEIICNLKQK